MDMQTYHRLKNIKDQEYQGTASDTMMNEQHLLPTGGRWVSLIR